MLKELNIITYNCGNQTKETHYLDEKEAYTALKSLMCDLESQGYAISEKVVIQGDKMMGFIGTIKHPHFYTTEFKHCYIW